ncbi:MAG: DUF1800 domain-containing protein [Gemmatimonadota bacterium]|nr:DUF1800 domain-containing protein [Gemmatimonadota bacterium]
MSKLLTFVALGAILVVVPAFTSSSTAGVPGREQTADEQVKHVLNRLAFGPRPGEYEKVRAMGVDKWIDAQLRPERIDDRVTDQFLAAHFPSARMSPGELMSQYPIVNAAQLAKRAQGKQLTRDDSMQLMQTARRNYQFVGQLLSERITRAEMSERQLDEVMTEFWLNHFNVFVAKGQPERYFLADYETNVIRPRAMGKFHDLLEAVAKSPAMLFYLDNWESMRDSTRPSLAQDNRPGFRSGGGAIRRRPGAFNGRGIGMNGMGDPRRDSLMQLAAQRRPKGLNENYGRELLELHTLGVDGGYTQQDVINAARALTGWTIDRPRQDAEFVFRPQMHDAGEKIVLGHTMPAGRGMEDGEELLKIVATHPATARFIATKLVRRFVSDSAPKALVDRAAATFTRTDGDIREVVRTIVTSDEFFSRAAYKSKVKTPFELVVSARRAVGAQPDTTPRTAQIIARLGQPIYGHQAPDGYPDVGDAWINTGSILNRINFGLALAAGRVPGVSANGWPDATTLAMATRDSQVDGVIRTFLRGEASPDTRKILLSGNNPLAATAVAVDTLTADDMEPVMRGKENNLPGARKLGLPAGDPLGRGRPQLSGLTQIVGLAFGAPEFQRR